MPYVPSRKTDGVSDDRDCIEPVVKQLAEVITKVSQKYGYSGAFAGELNFAITRLLQHLGRELVNTGEATNELRYWMQSQMFGVLLDVIMEYKVRVNQSYEIAQIQKSGDCYDTPYYSKPVEVVGANGEIVGHVYINLSRTDETLQQDIFADGEAVLRLEKRGEK